MDNDNRIKKRVVKFYRSIRLKLDYSGMNLQSESDGNKYIYDMVNEGKPFMLGRFGAVEMRCVSRWMKKQEYVESELEQLQYAAGFFPNDKVTIDLFCTLYSTAMHSCDALGVWEVKNEKKAIKTFCSSPVLIPIRSIEPYYHSIPWSRVLKSRRVLIIHPFVDSIQTQYAKRRLLFSNNDILPEFGELILIKAVQSNAGGSTQFNSWFEALDYMKCEIDKVDFDIAIIGAGAYGLPLASYVKGLGKQAIQMAGSTQLLFGIKGKRWDDHPQISKLYNKHWIRPSESETPPHIAKVEGGSYW